MIRFLCELIAAASIFGACWLALTAAWVLQ